MASRTLSVHAACRAVRLGAQAVPRRGRAWPAVFYMATVAVLVLLAATPTNLSAAEQTAGRSGPDRLTGEWVLDRSRGSVPPAPDSDGDERPAGRGGRGGPGGPGGGRPGGGGPPGAGGPGGFGGGFGGPRGGARMNPERMQAVGRYVRSLNQPAARLTIVATNASVIITDIEGRSQTLKTDGKAVEEKAENGLVKLKRSAKWTAGMFTVTIEIDDGPKIERRYEVSEGGTELRIVTQASGGRGPGGDRNREPIAAVYTRSAE